jgi:phage terminase large subunit GpA-like protein
MNLLDKYSTIAPSEWAERNIHLDYGRFDTANHPLLVDPLNAMCETRGAVVGLIGSVQAVKTLTAQIGQLYGLHIEPGRAAMYDLTESALREFSDDKFTPLIDSTDAIMEIVPEQPYRRTKFYTSTNYGTIRLLVGKCAGGAEF